MVLQLEVERVYQMVLMTVKLMELQMVIEMVHLLDFPLAVLDSMLLEYQLINFFVFFYWL